MASSMNGSGSINGVLSLPTQQDFTNESLGLSAKRKRDDNEDIQRANGPHEVKGKEPATSRNGNGPSQADIEDLIAILKESDTTPSILTRLLPRRASSVEPQAKRQKAEDVSLDQTTIAMRAASGVYQKLSDVLDDVDAAVADIEEKLQLPNAFSQNQYVPISLSQSDFGLRISAFKKRAHEIVRREESSKAQKNASQTGNPVNDYATNGSMGNHGCAQINAGAADNKMVLTLFGNAPGPKQLFSSFQIPRNVDGEGGVLAPVRQAGLPNGITTTQIVPIQSSDLMDHKKQPTLGEVFPSPANLPPLQPPKPSKNSTTRSLSVGWYQPSAADPFPRAVTYSKAQISCGQWLDYSNASPTQSSRKRQRDRALSLTSSKAAVTEPNAAESEAAKHEALFRSVYSSFAPSKDDSAAVAPTGILERMWWQQSGERHYEKLVENTMHMDAVIKPDSGPQEAAVDSHELEEFEAAVESYEKDEIDSSLLNLRAGPGKSAEEKDVEEILDGISELLETLNSYQRIRHMTLNPSSRPPGISSVTDTSGLGTPSKPSESEQATYEMLKSQLTLLIATLPPYAVSKLDPDKLSELRVSTKIKIGVEDSYGVMMEVDEDQSVLKAKAAATASPAAVARVPPATIHRSNPAALYGNQYSTSRAPSATPQYYGGTQTPVRAQPPQVQRAPSTAPVPYPVQRAAAPSSYRPTQGYNTPSYGAPPPRPVQQYSSSNQPQYLQTPAAQSYVRPVYAGNQNTPQATPQTAINSRAYASQPSYAPQAHSVQTGQDYRYSTGQNVARQASPQNQMYTPQHSTTHGRPYSNSNVTPSLQQNGRQYMTTPMMNVSPQQALQHGQPSYPSQAPSPWQSSFLSQQEQSNIVDRQRAQLAAQQQNQSQARHAAQATLGSPSPAQVNGINPVHAI
ncbi:hypothetical protein BJ875DRAFT_477129 [Amylocarpus encephaloides]|uniref:Uncharacterized protein n=1 Tax=Amylocarpus encephaloides TaxID=45428 RepID=A0A9P8BZR5_9HELO|nr:hypothetical protein BJ875DRAFT_477129 [Amylocarpus encephaloides]